MPLNKKNKGQEKEIVGPGYLPNLESSFFKEGRIKKVPFMTFPKSQAPRVIHQRASSNKYVPGVGTYKDVDLAFVHEIVLTKTKNFTISKTAFKRFSEEVSKSKTWVPGPGTYEIAPKLKSLK